MSRPLFLLAVTSERRESNRNSGLKLARTKPFKMLAGATTMNLFLRWHLVTNTNDIRSCQCFQHYFTHFELSDCFFELFVIYSWFVSLFDSLGEQARTHARACVIWPACTTSWLIVLWSGPLVMRVTQYHTKGTAADWLRLSQPPPCMGAPPPPAKAQPSLAPSFLPSLPPSDSPHSYFLFSYLHAGQNTRLLLHAKPSPERLRKQSAAHKNSDLAS